MDEVSVVVAMRRSSAGLDVIFKDRDGQCIAPHTVINWDLVKRSKQLEAIYDALDHHEEHNIPVNGSSMTAWLKVLGCVGCPDAVPTAELIAALQTADFLDDQHSVDKTIYPVASRLLHNSDADFRLGVECTVPQWVSAVNALYQLLPEQLILRILRAAFHVVNLPSELIMSIVDRQHPNFGRSPKSCALSALLEGLPQHLQTLALRATSPSVEAGEVCLDYLSDDATCSVILVAAGLPRLTSLSLKGHRALESSHTECVLNSAPAIAEATAALSNFSSLVSLQLENASAVLLEGLLQALPSLSQLTALSLKGSVLPSVKSSNVWANLCNLRLLRTLNVAEIGLKCVQEGPRKEHVQFWRFVQSLSRLVALEELVLSDNYSIHDGWGLLAQTTAKLPLRLLNVWNSVMAIHEVELHNSTSSTYTSLSLWHDTVDFGGDGVASELCRCTHLKTLSICCDYTHSQFWETLRTAPFVLESFACEAYQLEDDVFPQFLATQTGLRQLDIKTFADSSGGLPDAFARLTALQHLGLRSFEIPAAAFSLLTALTSLHFERLEIPLGINGHELAAAFEQLSALKELQVRYVEGVYLSHSAFAAAIERLAGLSHLTLGYVLEPPDLMHDYSLFELAEVYACSLGKLCHLVWLQLGGVNVEVDMGLDAVSVWTKEMAGMTRLQTLQLNDMSFLVGEAVGRLARALSNMTMLQRLQLPSLSEHCTETVESILGFLPESVVDLSFQT